MAVELSEELREFHRFVGAKLDRVDLSPEDALHEWRVQHPVSEVLAESVAAVRHAVADMRGGDCGRPVSDVLNEIRQRLMTGTSS